MKSVGKRNPCKEFLLLKLWQCVLLLFTFIIASSSCLSKVYSKDSITWMILDWPPWMILEGEDKGNGRFNHILKVAQDNLPEYDHVTEIMNWARFWHEVEQNNNICYPFGLKSGNRENLVYYSIPHTFVLPNAIIIKKADADKLGNPESYSIVTLLSDKRFNGYAEKNRSFTEKVDTLLKKYESGSNLTRVSARAESLIKMVSTGRIDYTIEYPIVAEYYNKKGDDTASITSIPISEMEPYSYVYLCCTKNEWGKRIIEKWNEVLRRIKTTDEYRSITEIGHTDKKELKLIRQYYEAFIDAQ
nr:TIGR02285 family protein [Desulfamplus magnetovallimortis]